MTGIFQNFGLPEILIILAVLLLLFGARKLPELARSMGRSSHEFRKGLKEGATLEEDEAGDEPQETVKAKKDAGTTEAKAAPKPSDTP